MYVYVVRARINFFTWEFCGYLRLPTYYFEICRYSLANVRCLEMEFIKRYKPNTTAFLTYFILQWNPNRRRREREFSQSYCRCAPLSSHCHKLVYNINILISYVACSVIGRYKERAEVRDVARVEIYVGIFFSLAYSLPCFAIYV